MVKYKSLILYKYINSFIKLKFITYKSSTIYLNIIAFCLDMIYSNGLVSISLLLV